MIRTGAWRVWEPFLWIALAVKGWRWLTGAHSSTAQDPLPNVDDAPPDAEPVFRPSLDDNGLATFSLTPPTRPVAEPRH